MLNGKAVGLIITRHPRARRYVLRVKADGSARVTIPRRGTIAGARSFVGKNLGWLELQLQRLAERPTRPAAWRVGTAILFRGEQVNIAWAATDTSHGCLPTGNGPAKVWIGEESVRVPDVSGDLRTPIERHLWKLAARELPGRVIEFAELHRLRVARVMVRNQRSRWGSCSPRGTISLNWRLIQAPPNVRDYIILHELCHLRQMNHSDRFWREVASVCPDYQRAELWLKRNGDLLK